MPKLTPIEEADALPPPVASLKPSQPTYDPTEGMSRTQLFLAGAGKGLTDAYRGAKQLVGAMTPEEYDEIKKQDAPLMNTTPGMAGNIVGQAAPFMAVPAGGIVRAAAIGAGQGAATPVGTTDSRALNTALGGVAGGVAQGALNVGGKILSGPSRFTTPAQQRLAARAKELGFDLSPGQITQNPNLKSVEAAFADLPITGGVERARAAANQTNLNTIAARAAGSTGSDLGENVVSDALSRSGGEIGRIARGATVTLDNAFVQDLINVADEVARMPQSLPGRRQAEKLIDEFVDKAIQRGAISGAEQQTARSVLRAAAASGIKDPRSVPLARAQKGVQSALDDALYRSIPAGEEGALKTARAQYAAGKSIEKAKPIGGNVSGPRLAEVMRSEVPSELRDAAQAMQAFRVDIPNSGTPTRGQFINLLQSPGALAAGALAGGGAASQTDNPYAVGAATGLGVLFGPRVAQAAYYNPAVRAYLQNGLMLGKTIPQSVLDAIAKLAPPAAISAASE